MKIKKLSEHEASELMVGYIRHTADLNDLAKLYSEYLEDDAVVVVGVDDSQSDVYKDGEQVPLNRDEINAEIDRLEQLKDTLCQPNQETDYQKLTLRISQLRDILEDEPDGEEKQEAQSETSN